MAWLNNDGLIVRFGTESAEKAKVSAIRLDGPQHLTEINIKYDGLPAVASNSVPASYEVIIPAGAYIESVEVIATTDFVSTGTLNIGIADADGGANVTDVDFFVAAATAAELNTGGINVAGWVGAGVGTVLTEAVRVTWEQDTAAASAGNGVVRVFWSVPNKAVDTLGD